MPVYVYAIRSRSHDIIYVGIAADVEARLKEHNQGKSKYTQTYRPWECFYTEEFDSYADARIREKQLKGHSGKIFLREQL